MAANAASKKTPVVAAKKAATRGSAVPARKAAVARSPKVGLVPSGGAAETPAHMVEQEKVIARKTRKPAASAVVDLNAPVRPPYWDEACQDLMKRDRILRKIIPAYGPAHLISRGDPFVTLARSVVGQQISVKAAHAVWERVVTACPKLTPAQMLRAGPDKLAACGLSKRKAEYILDLATHFKSGNLHVADWVSMEDEDVIAELIHIRGIGRWTAEMFLMFNLMRPNVLPLDDLGLIKAISVNYFSGEPVTRSEAREVAANWDPWRTVATWYLWRSLEPLPVLY
jgi:DNA-3-methyladenine glycosylase II